MSTLRFYIDVNGRWNPIPNIKTRDIANDAHGSPWVSDDYNGDVPKYLKGGKCFLLILFFGLSLLTCNEPVTDQSTNVVDTSIPVKEDEDKIEEKVVATETGNEEDNSNSYRNQNWQPQKGQYYFSEGYYFDYTYQNPGSDNLSTGEFGFYIDPETGTILLEKNLSQFTDEMTDYIIIKPNGDYIQGFTDEFGTKKVIEKQLSKMESLMADLAYVDEEFKTYFKPQQQFQDFGASKYYPKSLKGQSYQRTFLKSSDVVDLYIADTNLPTTALYLTGRVFEELGLPIKWDYGYFLPDQKLVVSEQYKNKDGQNIGFQLKSIMAAEYHLSLPYPD